MDGEGASAVKSARSNSRRAQLAQPMEDAVPAESTFERAQTLGWCLTCLPQQGRRLACEMQVIRQHAATS